MRPLAFLSRLKPDQAPSSVQPPHEVDNEKTPHVSSEDRSSADGLPERVAEDAQAGVQKIEATTSVWTRKALIIAYAMSVS